MRRLGLLFVLLLLAGCQKDRNFVLTDNWHKRDGFDESFLKSFQGDTITLPQKFSGTSEIPPYKGWITLQRELPNELTSVIASGEEVGITCIWPSDVAVFYLNETRFGNLGNVDPYEPGIYRYFIKDIPSSAFKKEKNILTIALYSDGIFPLEILGKITVGESSSVFTSFYYNETASLILIAIYFVVGTYHLLLVLKRPKDIHNLFFGVFAVLISAYFFTRTPSRDLLFGANVIMRTRVEYALVFALGPFLMFFISHFFFRKYDRFGLVLSLVWGVTILVTIFAPTWKLMNQCLTFWQMSALPAMVYIIFILVRETIRKNRDAMYLVFGLIVMTAGAFHDIGVSRKWWINSDMGRYTFLMFVLGIAWVLANNFMRVHNEVEELNTSLERKVEERTDQLKKSLVEVQTLKAQQDGDYFLTSLLLDPLKGNSAGSKYVSVDILTKQKKQFIFRKWDADIGGDLCVAANLKLKNRDYTVVLNGDAMGKSMQGAGGALVLGTAFKSLLTRAQQSSRAQDRYPEQWLKECFIELQNVFVAFDGSMLLSAVIALLDESSGLLYLVNAEHPQTCLYRNGTASFLEKETTLRKFGIPGVESGFYIQTFQLQPNDVVILGSDGRDDLTIGMSADGYKIVNEDESQFLRRVEEAEGDLNRLEKAILSFGELSDDLSLLRIGYKEDYPAIVSPLPAEYHDSLQAARNAAASGNIEESVQNFEKARKLSPDGAVLRELCLMLLKMKDYNRGARYCQAYTEEVPGETEFLYYTSFCLFKQGKLELAADFGERCRLRRPDLKQNLENLAKIYRGLGNNSRAEKILTSINNLV